MTALKPIENRRTRGVASERYPINKKCSHSECNEDAQDAHHIFPRSSIGNASYFVEITEYDDSTLVIPHVTGLCRAHHEDVEIHRSWIRLEDGVFVWYDREEEMTWRVVGPLDPQPAGREKVRKPKRQRFRGEARRNRRTISIRVPNDEAENGAALMDDLLEQWETLRGFGEKPRPPYYSIVEMGYVAVRDYDATEDFA